MTFGTTNVIFKTFKLFIMIHNELKYTEKAIFVVNVNRYSLHLLNAHVGEKTDKMIKVAGNGTQRRYLWEVSLDGLILICAWSTQTCNQAYKYINGFSFLLCN
jgi:hypothetical protein